MAGHGGESILNLTASISVAPGGKLRDALPHTPWCSSTRRGAPRSSIRLDRLHPQPARQLVRMQAEQIENPRDSVR